MRNPSRAHAQVSVAAGANVLAPGTGFLHTRARMKTHGKILLSLLAAIICATTFAADKPSCKKSGKNCPMNDNKSCNCGKDCGC